jgi:hypothetical protein
VSREQAAQFVETSLAHDVRPEVTSDAVVVAVGTLLRLLMSHVADETLGKTGS